MESDEATPSSSTIYGGDGGAGGKFKKPAARKPPSTPYDRPPVNQSDHRGWLSKLVDPAYRLISSSATKIMPSFFSKSPSTSGILPSDADDHGNCKIEALANASCDESLALDLGISGSDRDAGPSKVPHRLEDNSACCELKRDSMMESHDLELSKIEQLVKGKMFSKDEINRLTEILNSKVVPYVELEKQKPSLTAEGKAKRKALLAPENPITLVEEEEKDFNGTILGISSPRIQSNIQDEVLASPIDIAKAYMGSRASELAPGSRSIMSKSERSIHKGDELQSSPYFLPPSPPKSSTCWPGAMVKEQRSYITPESQRVTYGLHNFPRTPYSRTIFSKSKTKLTQLQADSRCQSVLSTPFQQSRTSIFGQTRSRTDVQDDGFGSVGAIRRTRNKFPSETPCRGSASLYSLQKGPSQVKESNASKVFFKEKTLELGGTSGTKNYPLDLMANEEGVSTLNLPPSPVVRGILEHLANKPTPNEMAAELKLATAWKRSPSKDMDAMPKESNRSTHLRGTSDSLISIDNHTISVAGTDDMGNSNSTGKSQETDAINAITKASSTSIHDVGVLQNPNAEISFGLKNLSDSHIKSTVEKASAGANGHPKDKSQLWPLPNQVNGQDVMTRAPTAAGFESLKKPRSHFSGMRQTLKSISVNKPDPKHIISSDNGPGFTFPFSASGVLSEPPTPSILPLISSPQLKEGSDVPCYTFGTKKSSPRLVFSFPSTSSASPTHYDASDLKFSFGSDKKTRVSFNSIGKDAICY